MKPIKLSESLTLDKNKEGFTMFSTIGNASIIVLDAPFERLKIQVEFREWLIEQLIFLKTPENSIAIDRVILDIEEEIKK